MNRSNTRLWGMIAAVLVFALRADAQPPSEPRPKNVIMIIGDGMGPQQLGLLFAYRRHVPGESASARAVERLIARSMVGMVLPAPADSLVTDSACAITQLASGKPCFPETLGVGIDGSDVPSALAAARRSGRAVGIVSDTRITHATPAGIAVHLGHRSDEDAVASDMIEAGPDLMLSGGLAYFLPKTPAHDATLAVNLENAGLPYAGVRRDSRNLLTEAKTRGYALAFSRSQLERADGLPLLGLFAGSAMRNGIAQSHEPGAQPHEPSLAELTEHALRLLGRSERGFFLMVESGQIDWAGHANDAGWLLHEMLKLEALVGVIEDWTEERSDTLVLMTADHETGGFGFAYKVPPESYKDGYCAETTGSARNFRRDHDFVDPRVLDLLYRQKVRLGDLVKSVRKDGRPEVSLRARVKEQFGVEIGEDEAARVLRMRSNRFRRAGHPKLDRALGPAIHDFAEFYPDCSGNGSPALARVLAGRLGVVWATGTHTSTPVMSFAHGPGHEAFRPLQGAVEFGAALQRILLSPAAS